MMYIPTKTVILVFLIFASSSLLAGCGDGSTRLATDSKSATRSSQLTEEEAASNAVVKVMIVYTASAVQAVGGEAAMAALIMLAEETTNHGYETSQVNVRIEIVKTMEVQYNENVGYDLALKELKGTKDGKLDEIHTIRENVGADVVSLWINNRTRYCGLAYQMKNVNYRFGRYAFNVVDYMCAMGIYAFAHEVGHNMGAGHDREHADAVSAYSYSFGYAQRVGASRFRTIMSYPCAGCTMLNRWSNPNLLHDGVPTGEHGVSDNAATLNNTRDTVSGFR